MVKKKKVPPRKSAGIPATKGHIDAVRKELKSDITSVDLKVRSVSSEIRSLKAEMNSRFKSMESKFESIDSKFESLDSKMDSKFEKLTAAIHKTHALIEAQEDRNRYVLDGYSQIYEQQKTLEKSLNGQIAEIKKMIKEQ